MASAAEQLIQQGREEGREEGRAATLRQTIERLLQLRFGPLDEPLRSRIASAPVEELERFIERVITATQLDDVFAG